MENRSSERSFSSVRPPVTPNVTGSSKTTSSVDPENIQSINVQFFSKILRKKKETIVKISIFYSFERKLITNLIVDLSH